MSVSLTGNAQSLPERPQGAAATLDLEGTTDLHEESTIDLAPATEDMQPPAPAGEVTVSTEQQTASIPPERRTEDVPEGTQPAPPLLEQPSAPPASAPPILERGHGRVAIEPGTVLLDRFLIEREIGRGGTATIYQARDMASSTGAERNERVAIKMPRPGSNLARASARLRHEFERARDLSHPSIARVYALHEHAGTCFMTMELVEGRPLTAFLRDWTLLPPPLAYKVLRECGQALAYAHSVGVVHGDFKPGNVLITPNEQVKVLDFGAAAAFASTDPSRIAAGTPGYASPEVLSGHPPQPSDDVFSFACVAYELLTGQHPFERRSSLEARAANKVPPRAWSLSPDQWLALVGALSWDRDRRPDRLEALLEPLLDDAERPREVAPVPKGISPVSHELPSELMPPRRGWGFFVFIACALAVTFIATRGENPSDGTEPLAQSPQVATALPSAPASSVMGREATPQRELGTPPIASGASQSLGADDRQATLASTSPAPPPPARPRATPPARLSTISFQSNAVTTSESSLAAVFVVERSPPLEGRSRVQWSVESASAQAGLDFVDAAGTIEFADGQSQRAIYVPLNDDQVREGREVFEVRLFLPQQARLGKIERARATILDDD
ncbi:MAG TPA: protein kinase [Steroidobacteraceae bacterium]